MSTRCGGAVCISSLKTLYDRALTSAARLLEHVSLRHFPVPHLHPLALMVILAALGVTVHTETSVDPPDTYATDVPVLMNTMAGAAADSVRRQLGAHLRNHRQLS